MGQRQMHELESFQNQNQQMIAYYFDTFCFNVSQTLKSTSAIYKVVLKVGIWELTLMHNKWLGITQNNNK
jgi:hypothetical protein